VEESTVGAPVEENTVTVNDLVEPILAKGRVLLVGPPGAGKTTLLNVLTGGEFNEETPPTRGVFFKEVENRFVREIGGHTTYEKLRDQYIANQPALVIVVIDVTSDKDFEEYQKVRTRCSEIENLILVTNKIDLDPLIPKGSIGRDNWPKHLGHFQKLDKQHPVIPTSAKDGRGLDWLIQYIVQKGLDHSPIQVAGQVKLSDHNEAEQQLHEAEQQLQEALERNKAEE
jgi:small GTP-binding protein